jgi:hypothetical protein
VRIGDLHTNLYSSVRLADPRHPGDRAHHKARPPPWRLEEVLVAPTAGALEARCSQTYDPDQNVWEA